MAVDAPHGAAFAPFLPVLPLPWRKGWRRAAEIGTACAAIVLAHVVQRYWPALAGEPAGRQLAFMKAMLVVPMLLSIDCLRSRRVPPADQRRSMSPDRR